MEGAVSMPLFFGDSLLRRQFCRREVPLAIKISNEAASNGWKLSKPGTATGTNAIRKVVRCYSSWMLLSEIPDFSLNLSCTGTASSVNTVISGYWMGPDDEEECGYVLALVQRVN